MSEEDVQVTKTKDAAKTPQGETEEALTLLNGEAVTPSQIATRINDGIKLTQFTVSRSEKKKGKAQYEMFDYFISYTYDVRALQDLICNMPEDERTNARRNVANAIVKKIASTEAYQAALLHSMQHRDNPNSVFWREGEKRLFE